MCEGYFVEGLGDKMCKCAEIVDPFELLKSFVSELKESKKELKEENAKLKKDNYEFAQRMMFHLDKLNSGNISHRVRNMKQGCVNVIELYEEED
jgi:hypothetical protein